MSILRVERPELAHISEFPLPVVIEASCTTCTWPESFYTFDPKLFGMHAPTLS